MRLSLVKATPVPPRHWFSCRRFARVSTLPFRPRILIEPFHLSDGPKERLSYGTEEQCRAALAAWRLRFRLPALRRPAMLRIKERLYQCGSCRHQVSLTAGTIFHSTKLDLIVCPGPGHPNQEGYLYELSRRLGVTRHRLESPAKAGPGHAGRRIRPEARGKYARASLLRTPRASRQPWSPAQSASPKRAEMNGSRPDLRVGNYQGYCPTPRTCFNRRGTDCEIGCKLYRTTDTSIDHHRAGWARRPGPHHAALPDIDGYDSAPAPAIGRQGCRRRP